MIIFFNGGENPGWRGKLYGWGARAISINFKHLLPRLPKKSKFLIADRFPADLAVMCQFEVPEEAPELVDIYRQWVEDNADRLTFAVEPDNIDAATIESLRADAAWIPIWRPENGPRALQRLTSTYTGIAVAQSAWDAERPVTPRLNRIVQAESTHVHGLGVSKAEILGTVAFGSISTGAWMSASRYGETQVWDGSELRRFPADNKEARARYRGHIVRAGVDIKAVEADDRDAVCELAIWSWQQFEEALSRRRELNTDTPIGKIDVPNTTPKSHGAGIVAAEAGEPMTTALERGTGRGSLQRTRETMTLPIMVVDQHDVEGSDGETTSAPIARLSGESVRHCDSCQLSSVCPSYEMGASCAFKIPLQVRTFDQLMALGSALLEMQGHRILLARFAEDLEGTVDKALSDELDRMMRMMDGFRNLADNRDVLKVQVEARAGSGVLSRIFGTRVGEQAKLLPGGGLDAEATDDFAARFVDVEEAEVVPNTSAS